MPFLDKCGYFENVDRGAYTGVPVLTDQAQAARNLKFCKFFIFNELLTFFGYIFLKFFCCRFLGIGGFLDVFVDFCAGCCVYWYLC